MGPSVKFVLAILDSISDKKGVIFFLKKGHEGVGGSEGFVSDATKFTLMVFGIFLLDFLLIYELIRN